MKVCLISGSYPPMRCGVGDYTLHLAQALTAQDLDVAVLTSILPDELPRNRVFSEVRSWHLPGFAGLLAAMDRIQPEVVHLQYPSEGYGRGLGPNLLLPWLAAFRPRVRRVLTLHEYAIFSGMGRTRLWPALAAAHKIICTNHQDRRLLKRHQPNLARKIRVIPLGSSLGQAAGRADSPAPGREWLAHFGMVMPNKGWETLIPALQILTAQGRDLGVLAVAELQPEKYAYHRLVRDQIERAGLADRIRFTGFLEEAAAGRSIQACRIAVAPFRNGARLNRSSLVALLAQGLAVVCSRPSQPLEGLRHEIHYWNVAPDDPSALASGVLYLLDHPDLIRQLQLGANRVAGRFAWPRIAAMTKKAYLG